MFVHCVYFWLRNDLSAEPLARCHAGVRSLAAIDSAAP